MIDRQSNRVIRPMTDRASMVRSLGRAFIVSGAGQVVSSLTNFGIVLYLVRAMDKAEFGLYSLGFALVLLAAGLATASIAVQFVVNLPDQADERRAIYAANHLASVGIVGVAALFVAIVSTIALEEFAPGSGSLALPLVPIAAAAAVYALRDLLMRVAFSERREHVVLGSNVAVATAVAVAFLVMALLGCELSASAALCVYALGQMAGALCALAFLRLPLGEIGANGVLQAFGDSWRGGRWSILTSLAYNLRTQSHNFVVGPLLGAAALADLHASRVLLTPAAIAIPPLSQVLMPRLAEARRDGHSFLRRMEVVSIALQASVAAAYSIVLLPLLPLIVPRVLGDAYAHVGPLVAAWGVVVLLMAIRTGLTMVLEAGRAFRDLLFLNMIVAVVTFTLVVGLSSAFGSVGAVAAIGISELLLCAGLFSLYKSRLQATLSPELRGTCRDRPRQTDRHPNE